MYSLNDDRGCGDIVKAVLTSIIIQSWCASVPAVHCSWWGCIHCYSETVLHLHCFKSIYITVLKTLLFISVALTNSDGVSKWWSVSLQKMFATPRVPAVRNTNVKVFVRIRPLLPSENEDHASNVLHASSADREVITIHLLYCTTLLVDLNGLLWCQMTTGHDFWLRTRLVSLRCVQLFNFILDSIII